MEHHQTTAQSVAHIAGGLSLMSVPVWLHNLSDWAQVYVMFGGVFLTTIGIGGFIWKLFRNSGGDR